MSRNILKRLRISHFKSVADEIVIDFPPNGMVQVKGKNLTTGGSSGAGKSLMLTALNIALGCSSHPMSKAQSWYSDEAPEVALEWESDQHGPCMIVRGKKTVLTVGNETVTGAANISRRMDAIFGIQPELMKVLTYRPQRDFNDFLTKTNSEKQKFLMIVLNLLQFEDALKVSENALKALKVDEAVCEDRVKVLRASVENAVAAWTDAKNSYVAKSVEDQQSELKKAQERKQVISGQISEKEVEIRKLEQDREQELKLAARRFLQEGADADQLLNDAQVTHQTAKLALPQATPEELAVGTRVEIGKKKLLEVQAADMEKNRLFLAQSQKLDTEIATIKAEARQLTALETQLKLNEREIIQNSNAIQKLEQNLCSTCGQTWTLGQDKISELKGANVSLTAGILKYTDQIKKLKDDQVRLGLLQAERAALKFSPDPLINQINNGIRILEGQVRDMAIQRMQKYHDTCAEVFKKVTEAEERVWEVEQKVKKAQQEVLEKINGQRAVFIQAVAELKVKAVEETMTMKGLEGEIALIQERNRSGEAAIKTATNNVAAREKEFAAAQVALAEVSIKANMERDFVGLIGREGFLGRIFDEVLTEISTETNLILGRVANTAHVTIEFQSEFQNGSGNVEKEIRTRALVSGNETDCDSTGLSGGMLSAISVAVKVAIRRVVFRRAGINLGWNILDEAFDGLDLVSKEACFEILNEEAQDGLVLVVDHSSEFEAMFPTKITMVYKDGITTLSKETT